MDIEDYTWIIAYAVGTGFGMFVGSKWAFEKGVLFGVSTTLVELEQLKLLQEGWADDEKIAEKLEKRANELNKK